MMDKTKHAICTVLLAMKDNHVSLPERAAVLPLRGEKHNFKSAFEALMPSDVSAGDAQAVAESVREWSATLKPYNDESFRKKFTDIHELVAEWSPGAAFSSKIKPDDVPPPPPKPKPALITAKQLLPTLNGLLKLQKKPTLKSWKGSREALEKRIDATRAEVEAHKPPTKNGHTVVAEGAYKTEEEAFARTGHRTNGKTKKMVKDEKRKERFIEKRITPTGRVPSANSAITNRPKKGEAKDYITLADVARTLNMQPKVARGKGRRYAKELLKLQIDKDSKYKYAPANAEAVAKILKDDGRKK